MLDFLACRSLLLVLLASSVAAQDLRPNVRKLYLSEDPRDAVPWLYVGSRMATVLRFEQDVDSARTSLLGWEGWFEPLLVGGKSVVLVPLQPLSPEEHFLLRVTLVDKTELPFVVTGRDSGRVDQQVDVFPDRETADAVRSRLFDAYGRERLLREENERYRKEEISVDHALAALLVRGAVKLTPFIHVNTWQLPWEGMHMEVRHFSNRAGDKTALVFSMKNQDPDKPWKLMEARLLSSSTGEDWPFAMRMDRAEIGPGSSGTLAIVADVSAFDFKKGAEKLVLQLFQADGLMVANIALEGRDVRK
ncbi:DUF2381 family protein [Stigmatella sp. ncwal1]|uniref:DUF2381 family protein n=1 Tax=Stigmatella ashevillensis TaxID=2995309 RepID=A0ABT5DD09_9BACT|nr:DUF2381 family protein [Stigmatella ashevillena]MDC0711518.1 DUF2381 family protein [Stigmatella ashevillena]